MPIEKLKVFKGDDVVSSINSIIDVVNDLKTLIESKEIGFDIVHTKAMCKDVISKMGDRCTDICNILYNTGVTYKLAHLAHQNLVYYSIQSLINNEEKNKTDRPFYYIDSLCNIQMTPTHQCGIGAFTFYSKHGATLFLELFPKSELIEFIALRGTNK